MDKKDDMRIPAQIKVFTAEGRDSKQVAEDLEKQMNAFIKENVSIVLGVEYSTTSVNLEQWSPTGQRPQTLIFSALLTYKK